MFINYSNHPSTVWTIQQIEAALVYGDTIIDIPFPSVDPTMDEKDLHQLALREAENILDRNSAAVICQGEFGLSFSAIQLLLKAGTPVAYKAGIYIVANMSQLCEFID